MWPLCSVSANHLAESRDFAFACLVLQKPFIYFLVLVCRHPHGVSVVAWVAVRKGEKTVYQAWLPKPKHDTNYVPCFPREGLRLAGVEAARTNPRGAGPSGTRSSRTRLPSTPPRDFAALSDTRIGTTTWVTGWG